MLHTAFPDSIVLDFGLVGSLERDPKLELITSLSGVAGKGAHLWTVSDETRTVECLQWTGDHFGQAASYKLGKVFHLPPGSDEVDLEGLSLDGDHLWIIGSHSWTRRKLTQPQPAKAADSDKSLKPGAIRPRPSRQLLGRMKLSTNGSLAIADNGRFPSLPFEGPGSLRALLGKDELIGDFVKLPDKENGLDIEGIAASGDRVMLGLRGPVLDGEYAVVVELHLEGDDRLRARRIGADKRRYRRHFVPLGGCGIRSLFLDGMDLVMIAGPTMNLSGPFFCKVWRNAMDGDQDGVVSADRLTDGPSITAADGERPEAITRIAVPGHGTGWLVLHDRPADRRYDRTGIYRADFIPAPLPAP
ncbi:MAG: DUF3616 domain-containing protein [Acetobacteraceae bacterium]